MSVEGKAATRCRVPAFFVIGPPRTGTSWLHEVLSERTLLPNPTKETRFFDLHFHRGFEWYCAHYPNATGGLLMGEVAPTYFASAEARQRIAKTIPKVKIICVFRDPVARMLSLYRLKLAYGMIRMSFEEAVVRDPELMETSRYATHLKAWRKDFGAEQILATSYDDLEGGPQQYLDKLLDFIGVPRFDLAQARGRLVHATEGMTLPRSYYRTKAATAIADWLKARRLDHLVASVRNSGLRKLFLGGGAQFAEPSPKLIANLYKLCRAEVEELEVMLNRDFSAWKISDSPGSLAAKKNENSANVIQSGPVRAAAIIEPALNLIPSVHSADGSLVQTQLKAKC
jgi:hypothetical protein